MKIKVGIIGFGSSGKFIHTGLLKAHDGYEITAVASSRAKDVHKILPKAFVAKDFFEIVKRCDVDLVIVCTPNAEHFKHAAAALESGKHVVVEKPFVTKVDDGKKLIALAEKTKKVLTVFHNRRWDGDFLTVKKLIASGKLGEIKQFESHLDRWRPQARADRWKEQNIQGAGTLFDLGPHYIDQMLCLFGKPDRVIADFAVQRDQTLGVDYFHLIAHYGNMRAILHSSYFTDVTPRFQIFGTDGNFLKYGVDPQEDQLKQNQSPRSPNFGIENKNLYGTFINPATAETETIKTEKGNFLKFYDLLHKKIVSGQGEAPISAEEALKVIEIIEESVRVGYC
ncbi:MAG: hypothetical protein A4S09_13055 [Proteobacteria bacterium SG_bin7]|nr:MAG: hypothetical protein A4S09_13055 [Proteobacteria bacterium SG_bin7]